MQTPPDPEQPKRMFPDNLYQDGRSPNSGNASQPPPPKPPKRLGTIALVFLILLTIPAVIFTLLGIGFLFAEGSIWPLLFALGALFVVFPGFHSLHAKIPFLRFPPLNMFFCIVLLFASMIAIGATQVKTAEDSQPDVPPITLTEVRLCTTLVEGTCDGDYNLFVRDNPQLFIVGVPDNFADDTPVTLEVNYTSQPGKTEMVKKETFAQPLKEGKLALTYKPESLPVGSYQLTLGSEVEGFKAVSKSFDVWPSKDWIRAIADKTKPEVDTEIEAFRLCVDTDVNAGAPLPDKATTTGSYDRCPTDAYSFGSDITALKADADLKDAKDGVQLTFQWFYRRNDGTWQEINKNTVDLDFALDGFLFALRGDFPPGDYEVLALLEASNQPPFRHPFTITKAQ